jgi:tetrapyrrole methylase family protein/MazG family protein
MTEFDDLVSLMDRLRSEDGCPWDRQQTPRDLRGYLLEEAYEVVEAIDSGSPEPLCEELGDLLFQIVFLSRIASEEGQFTVRDVARGIEEKMRRRHPHVFGDSTASTPEEVLLQWEEIKRREKQDKAVAEPSALDGIPRSLPALLRAERLGTKASRVGFDWSRPDEVLAKVDEEIAELRAAVAHETPERVAEEFGDLLFALANLARHLGVHAEGALQETNERFTQRFRKIEGELRQRGSDPGKESLEELERLWRKAKES